MQRVYHFTQDPKGGFLDVPRSELGRLGIADSIGPASKARGDRAYLHPGEDMKLFVVTKQSRGEPCEIRTRTLTRKTKIRTFPMYGGDTMVERVCLMTGKTYQERRDTPLSCSPASETYWSM